jgi:proteasome lid subunit RPN8/RPN11
MTLSSTAVAAAQELYQFQLELFADDGQRLHAENLAAVVFDRAVRATEFEAFRTGREPVYASSPRSAHVSPRFPNEGVDGRTCGFRVTIPLSDGSSYSHDFALSYFHTRAMARKSALVRGQQLASDAAPSYHLLAYCDQPASPPAPGRFTIDAIPTRLPIELESEPWDAGEPWDEPTDNVVQVSILKSVLEQSLEEARQHPDQEIAGFLGGKIQRDRASRVRLLVTCLISGSGTTEATATSVTFTPATFQRAREFLKLRGEAEGEIIVGNLHSHPFRACAECPVPMPTECVNKILFFSQQDVVLMESTFDQPYMVGLLVGIEPRLEAALGHLPVRLYGFHNGQVVERGFHVVAD